MAELDHSSDEYIIFARKGHDTLSDETPTAAALEAMRNASLIAIQSLTPIDFTHSYTTVRFCALHRLRVDEHCLAEYNDTDIT
ncbi:hypothetical protein BZJ19_14455 [Salinivibrio proteolyticus]|nr:hypothetical protein BZJ19_14455 [Salinivibrio proteolyticus]